MPAPRPLLLLEVNEIPWRLLDRYRQDARYPSLARFFSRAETYTTITQDTGQLHPWVTWPSFHRGIPDHEHGIRNLGQDPASFRGTPIWDEFRSRGLSVGVCGSLQSWPPKDPGTGGFWIPDTFARDERCIPASVEPLQRFNLNLVRMNGRVVNSRLGAGGDLAKLAISMPRIGIRPRTLFALARQLVEERRDSSLLARRPIFQSILFWDVFRRLYSREPAPAFASFFTNHVAGVMHRYWKHVFPEDFDDVEKGFARSHLATMDFAMQVVEGMVADALAWLDRSPDLVIAFATSMGQHAVHHEQFEGYEAAITNLGSLLDLCGVPRSGWKETLSMVPEASLDCADADLRARIAGVLRAARSVQGKDCFWVEEIGESLSIIAHTPRRVEIEGGVFRLGRIDDPTLREQKYGPSGLSMLEVEKGSGHHMPEGILALVARDIESSDGRTPMKATDAKRLLMERVGLS